MTYSDIQDKVNGCITNEDAVKTIQELEQIIQNKKNDIVCLATMKVAYFTSLERRNDL